MTQRITSKYNLLNLEDDIIESVDYITGKKKLQMKIKHIIRYEKNGNIYKNKYRIISLNFIGVITIKNLYEIFPAEIIGFHKRKMKNIYSFKIYLDSLKRIPLPKNELPLIITCKTLKIEETNLFGNE